MGKRRTEDFTTPEGVERWVSRCGFETYTQAAEALGVDWRTFWRYRTKGLPGKKTDTAIWRDQLLARMENILRKAEKKRL